MFVMKNLTKVALGSTLAMTLVFVSSCGQPPKADSKSVLSDARSSLAAYLTTDFSKDMHTADSGQSKGTFTATVTSDTDHLDAKITGTIDGSQEVVKTGTGSSLNSQIALNASANIKSTSFTGEGKLDTELRVLGEKLYVVLNDISVKSGDQTIQDKFDKEVKPFITLYNKKWFFLDLAALSGGKAQVKIDNAAYAKIAEQLKSKELFDVVSELPSEDGMYVYRVKPNKEGIKALMLTISTILETPTQPTDADMSKLIDDLSAENITHKLYVSTNKEYKKLVTTGTITEGTNTVTIGSTFNSKKKGDIEWTLTNTTKATSGEDNITIHVEKAGEKYTAKVDAKMGSTKSAFSIDANADFVKKDAKIETPDNAQDIMGLAAALYGMNSASSAPTTMDAPVTNVPTEE